MDLLCVFKCVTEWGLKNYHLTYYKADRNLKEAINVQNATNRKQQPSSK